MNDRTTLFFSCSLILVLLFGARLQGTAGASPAVSAAQVPIGGVILWFGRANEIPEGYEACDGRGVVDRDSVFRGRKPDLQGKFPRGAENFRSFVPQSQRGGGSDEVDLSRLLDHVLTSDDVPKHSHEIAPHAHGIGEHEHEIAGADLQGATEDVNGPDFYKVDAANDGVTGGVSEKNPMTLDSSRQDTESYGDQVVRLEHRVDPSEPVDNRPAYLEMVFLIRVK